MFTKTVWTENLIRFWKSCSTFQGQLKPNDGSIGFLSSSSLSIRPRLVLVHRQPQLYPYLTVCETILFICRLRNTTPSNRLINQVLDLCDLTATQLIKTSTINQQKLLIISTELLGQPDLLFLLQPTVFLTQDQTIRLGHFLKQNSTKSTLFASFDHSHNSLANLFAQTHLLHEHRLLFSGDLGSLNACLVNCGLNCCLNQHPVDFALQQLHANKSADLVDKIYDFCGQTCLTNLTTVDQEPTVEEINLLFDNDSRLSKCNRFLPQIRFCPILTRLYFVSILRQPTFLLTTIFFVCLSPTVLYVLAGTDSAQQSPCSFLHTNSSNISHTNQSSINIFFESTPATLKRMQMIYKNSLFVLINLIAFTFGSSLSIVCLYFNFHRQALLDAKDGKYSFSTFQLVFNTCSIAFISIQSIISVLIFYFITGQNHSKDLIPALVIAFLLISSIIAFSGQLVCLILPRSSKTFVLSLVAVLFFGMTFLSRYFILSPGHTPDWLIHGTNRFSPITNSLDLTFKINFYRPECRVEKSDEFDLDHLLELVNLSLDQFSVEAEPIRDIPKKVKDQLRHHRWTTESVNLLAESFLDLDDAGMERFQRFWTERDNFVLHQFQIYDPSWRPNLDSLMTMFTVLWLLTSLVAMAKWNEQLSYNGNLQRKSIQTNLHKCVRGMYFILPITIERN